MFSNGLRIAQCLVALVLTFPGVEAAPRESDAVKPFKIDLSQRVPKMLDLIKRTQLPERPVYADVGSSAGIDLDVLKALQHEWIHDFDWKVEQTSLNKYHHFTTKIEGLNIHFLHEPSKASDAIPLLLIHGWPGSFLEFLPVVEPLIKKSQTSTGKPVAFNLIVPSLPGFAFSAAPPVNWTIADTARVFNTLVTDILGYKTYAVHGTDWGSGVAYSIYEQFNKTARALHAPFIPFYPMTREELVANNISLSPGQEFQLQLTETWSATGNGYFNEQTTKANTIGLALEDNPIGQLAWIGEKIIEWSDPRAGTGPSIIDHREILRSTSLYYLTQSFTSSVFIYFMNPNGFRKNYIKAPTDAPLLFSSFKYNIGFWAQGAVEKVGNLVYYKTHDFGGHFPGIDNPPALIEDIREIANYWE